MMIRIKNPELFSVNDIMTLDGLERSARAQAVLQGKTGHISWDACVVEVMEQHALAHGIIPVRLRRDATTIHAYMREREITDYAVRHPVIYLRDRDVAFEIRLYFG